jgi:hypothetical protein
LANFDSASFLLRVRPVAARPSKAMSSAGDVVFFPRPGPARLAFGTFACSPIRPKENHRQVKFFTTRNMSFGDDMFSGAFECRRAATFDPASGHFTAEPRQPFASPLISE